MNEEYLIIYQITVGGLGLVFSSFCYSLGGRKNKSLRRFLGSFIMAATFNGICLWRGMWSPWFIGVFPILAAGYSLGYSAEYTWLKIIRRSIYVSAILMSGVLISFVLGGSALGIFIPHFGVAFWSVYLGTKNPIFAASEEFLVSMVMNLFLIAYPFLA